jgi:hypothetical protein
MVQPNDAQIGRISGSYGYERSSLVRHRIPVQNLPDKIGAMTRLGRL